MNHKESVAFLRLTTDMNYLLSYICLCCVCLQTHPVLAQIGMGGPPHSSAVLDLKSPANDKVFYPPRLTTMQRKPGAFVYDTDQNTMYMFDGVYWLPLALQSLGNVAPVSRLADDGAADNALGDAVAISGNYAIAGADGIYSPSLPGAAYMFVRTGNNWVQQQKLTPSDGGVAGGSLARAWP